MATVRAPLPPPVLLLLGVFLALQALPCTGGGAGGGAGEAGRAPRGRARAAGLVADDISADQAGGSCMVALLQHGLHVVKASGDGGGAAAARAGSPPEREKPEAPAAADWAAAVQEAAAATDGATVQEDLRLVDQEEASMLEAVHKAFQARASHRVAVEAAQRADAESRERMRSTLYQMQSAVGTLASQQWREQEMLLQMQQRLAPAAPAAVLQPAAAVQAQAQAQQLVVQPAAPLQLLQMSPAQALPLQQAAPLQPAMPLQLIQMASR